MLRGAEAVPAALQRAMEAAAVAAAAATGAEELGGAEPGDMECSQIIYRALVSNFTKGTWYSCFVGWEVGETY